MLNRKNTANPHRISVWNDNVFNSFDLLSEEELKFYSFGDGGDGGDADAASDPAEADTAGFDAAAAEAAGEAAAIGMADTEAELGSIMGQDVTDLGSLDAAIALANTETELGQEMGQNVTSLESTTFSVVPSLLGLAAKTALSINPATAPIGLVSLVADALGKVGSFLGNETMANIGNFSVENIANTVGQEVGLPSSLTSDLASLTVGPSRSSISSPAAESLFGSNVGISAPVGSENVSSLSSSPIGSESSTGGLGSLGVGSDDGGTDSGIGIVDTVRQNPLAVRPQSEVASASLDRLPIRRRPFNFVPGIAFAQSGGGIQSLIKQGPTLLDVVNQGMSIPKQTAPTQRMSPAAFNQRQPGGLRSTNYYTNAMQPASFYAQPQQVRNYGSIY
jgi:hypothetical protein